MTMADAPHPRPTLEQPGQLLQPVQPVPMVERHATASRGGVLAAIFVGLMLALFLSALDQTIVDTALPHMGADLHCFDRYTWVLTAYLLASTAIIPIAGKLSDQFGLRDPLLGAIALVAVSSVLAGAAQTMMHMIVLRGCRG